MEKDVEIEEMSPKAKYTDEVLMSETILHNDTGCERVRNGAKQAFSDFLFKRSIIFRQSGVDDVRKIRQRRLFG